jgi:hypothetical protein
MTTSSALTVLFVALKLTGYITWPWVWVLSPVWLGLAVFIGGSAIVGGITAVLEVWKKRS